MHALLHIALWLVVLVALLPGGALSVLRASRQPIALNLRRVPTVARNVSASSTLSSTLSSPSGGEAGMREKKSVRSVPLLFQQLLGIVPGEPFHFDLNRWRVLQNCGLFANLTARTVSQNGTVSLLIFGDELPAITFAPEFSVGASLTRPEVSGGMLFRDNNFRGMGDRVEVIASFLNNQGIEAAELTELLPSVHLKWTDGIRGRPSSVSVAVDSDHCIEDLGNLVPRYAAAGSKEKRQVGVDRVSARFQGSRGVHSYEMEPYNVGIALETPPTGHSLVEKIRLSGAKLKYSLPFVDLLYDGGLLQALRPPEEAAGFARSASRRKKRQQAPPAEAARYHRTALDITSPPVLLYDLKPNASASALRVLGVAKWRLMKAWGTGCLPLYHFSSIEDTNYIRGLSPSSSADYAPKVPFYSILKFDAFLQGLQFGTPGIFVDAGRFERFSRERSTKEGRGQQEQQQQHQEVTVGLSVKSNGLRVDVGFPSFNFRKPKIHLNLDV